MLGGSQLGHRGRACVGTGGELRLGSVAARSMRDVVGGPCFRLRVAPGGEMVAGRLMKAPKWICRGSVLICLVSKRIHRWTWL